MEIVHYKSIKEIPQNEWEKYGLDFALSDGVYDYAIYNEKYSVYSVSYLKIISRKTIFCIMYQFKNLGESVNEQWYVQYLKKFFGEHIVENIKKLGYKKIVLIMFPKMKENIVDIENSVTRYLQNLFLDKKWLLIYSLFEKPKYNKGYIYKQPPYMYFKIDVSSMDEYLEKSNSKVRHTIKNDRGRLIKNKVSIRKINYKTYYNEICELNRLSLYKMPKSLLQYILKLEKNNISDTIVFFKNDKLVSM